MAGQVRIQNLVFIAWELVVIVEHSKVVTVVHVQCTYAFRPEIETA